MGSTANSDTWGISGPAFLVLYLVLIVAVAVAAAVHRRILFRGDTGVDVDRLGPQQIAYLNGGARLAVYTALGGLRAAGALGTGPGRTLVQSGPLPSGVTPLDTAVHHAAGRQVPAREVGSDQWVVRAVEQLRDGLETAGLAVTRGQRRAALMWSVAGAAVVLLGFARLVDGLQNDRPVGFLLGLIVLAAVVTVWMLVRASATRTPAASTGLMRMRHSNAHLAPAQRPSYATYGATGAAMGVALYGAGALYLMDPAFAAEAEIRQAANNSLASGGSGCSSGSSCSSGGGGGGGGCGGGGGGCGG
ncbi:TIGR04222 domain-containing membrane protein [Jidongwangia harbinensis]|uniref:TIGR04222 domain-containing membrane protein n=1 Tax=Jidongwangia harbinensis TaxID=2878561 RepID=UPI001CD99529|nr:TIGR04222 domain-containing membrane protein [Jidongwangia harbinensis]MCA2212232.1 TIGR04222 domain-containing membrane protein [Jidongwangia harbinensis]